MKSASKITLALVASLSMAGAVAQTAPVKPAPPSNPRIAAGPDHKGHGQKDITRADFLAKAGERFDRVDTNKDGVLAKDERRAERQLMREHGGMHPRHPQGQPPGGPGEHKGPPPPGGPGPAPSAGAPQR
jgi:hypothetical protein